MSSIDLEALLQTLTPADPAAIAALASLFGDVPVAVLTGAGISTDSGIPDYRGKGTPPRTPMSITEFMNDETYRKRFWAGARAGAGGLSAAVPNAGHTALSHLEAAGLVNGIITQNVDGLHARSGSRNVVELHGGGDLIRCVDNGHHWRRTEVLGWFDSLNPGFAERNAGVSIAPDGDALVQDFADVAVPVCPGCGSLLRPNVVYFGELVPRPVFERAETLVDGAGALLLAGSSLAVNTGIRLVNRAEKRGIPLAIINRGPTAVDGRANLAVRIEGGTTETLSALAKALG